jgi:hypothetical protein
MSTKSSTWQAKFSGIKFCCLRIYYWSYCSGFYFWRFAIWFTIYHTSSNWTCWQIRRALLKERCIRNAIFVTPKILTWAKINKKLLFYHKKCLLIYPVQANPESLQIKHLLVISTDNSIIKKDLNETLTKSSLVIFLIIFWKPFEKYVVNSTWKGIHKTVTTLKFNSFENFKEIPVYMYVL